MKYMCLHNWAKWGRPIVSYSGTKFQWRECVKCGKVARRSIFWDNQCDLSSVNRTLDEIAEKALSGGG